MAKRRTTRTRVTPAPRSVPLTSSERIVNFVKNNKKKIIAGIVLTAGLTYGAVQLTSYATTRGRTYLNDTLGENQIKYVEGVGEGRENRMHAELENGFSYDMVDSRGQHSITKEGSSASRPYEFSQDQLEIVVIKDEQGKVVEKADASQLNKLNALDREKAQYLLKDKSAFYNAQRETIREQQYGDAAPWRKY